MTALHTTNEKGHGCYPVPFSHHLTSGLDSDRTIHKSKAEANLIARLALAGHSVHELRNAGYLVSKYGYTYQANDLDELHSFAVRLGVAHE